LKRLGLWAVLAATVTGLSIGSAISLADTPPAVTIDPPSEVGYTSAHLSGTVNPSGGPSLAYWGFEYTTTPDEPGSWLNSNVNGTIEAPETEKTEPLPVEGTLQGLQPGVEYAVRLIANNEDFANHVETQPPYPTFTTLATDPPSVTIDPSGATTATTAEVSGTIDPEAPAGNPAAFDVFWHFECVPGCGSQGGTIAADSSSHAVAETLTGLEPNTDYEVKLVASNAGASGSAGPIVASTAPAAPRVQALYAGDVGGDSAVLSGRVNPLNSAVTYQFEWGTDNGYGNVAPASARPLGSADGAFHVVTAPLADLQEGTTYHFRLLATNTETGETTIGADRAFTTLVTAGPPAPCPNAEVRVEKSTLLPECRGYEQVSPVDKDYNIGFAEPFVAFAAQQGDAAAFSANGPLPGSEAGAIQNVYVSRREPSGWSLVPLAPPQTPIPGSQTLPNFFYFSPDLRFDVVATGNPTLVPEADPNLANVYAYDNLTDTYRLLSVAQFAAVYRTFFDIAGATPDFSRVGFSAQEPYTSEGINGAAYEWDEGEVRLVSILPNGEPTYGYITHSFNRSFHAFSDDGSRIYFFSGALGPELYLRKNGTETVHVSASQRTTPVAGDATTQFRQASSDGRIAFFTDRRLLTDDAEPGSGENLYAFDAESGELTDLSVNPAGVEAEVLGLVGASDDGSYAYFVARGDLAPGATPGAPNLYLWHGGEAKFLMTLAEADTGDWQAGMRELTSQVTPDGRHLLLTSAAQLTGYDNTNASSGQPDPEVYRYSADAGELVCVSCHGDGAAPEGGATLLPVSSPVGTTRYIERFISDDGNLVVFDTPDALVERDSNGKHDVYAYRGGKVSLLSSGSSEFPSRFADMSADGKDVFFVTKEQLLKSDDDGFGDLYDARLGGGFAVPPQPIPPCAGGECIRNASTPPAAPNLGSSTYRGDGNVKPGTRCRKNQRRVRRHGKARCVKKHRRHHRKTRGAGSNQGGNK